MAGNPVSWFEIAVNDMPRARSFYETVFQITLVNLPSPEGGEYWTFPMQEGVMGAGGALTTAAGMRAGPGGTMIYFQSDDCLVEEGRVASAGGKVLESKRSIGDYGFISICMDSEGNPFGLYSQK